jgi:HlyD family secretion protein
MNQSSDCAGARSSLRPPLLAGTAVALAFFAGFGGWAALAPLEGAAVAPAQVTPEGSRKTVQHLEAGIVRRILVQDGSRVIAGEPLVQLDDTRARAEHAALLVEWRAAKAREARLLAEQEGRDAPAFPAALTEAAGAEPALARLLAGETERLNTRRAALRDQQAVLAERIAQSQAEIAGLQAQIASGGRQLALIEEEIGIVGRMLVKGLALKSRLLALERSQAEIEGTIGSDRAAIARAGQQIAESRQRSESLVSTQAEEVAADLAETRKNLAGFEEKLRATADALARTVVVAPVAGTVVNLRIKTPGGVIGAGEALMDLVPATGDLLLEARVAPVDIDEVHPGLEAQVHLLAYQSRNLPRIEGRVREVSADRLEDPTSHRPYYLARVAVDRATLPAAITLTPGMPADVMIVTGRRTLLDYLTRPLADALRRGMRET